MACSLFLFDWQSSNKKKSEKTGPECEGCLLPSLTIVSHLQMVRFLIIVLAIPPQTAIKTSQSGALLSPRKHCSRYVVSLIVQDLFFFVFYLCYHLPSSAQLSFLLLLSLRCCLSFPPCLPLFIDAHALEMNGFQTRPETSCKLLLFDRPRHLLFSQSTPQTRDAPASFFISGPSESKNVFPAQIDTLGRKEPRTMCVHGDDCRLPGTCMVRGTMR